MARLAELAAYDVPLDFWEGYVAAVQGVDAGAVRGVATDLMGPTGVVIVVAYGVLRNIPSLGIW